MLAPLTFILVAAPVSIGPAEDIIAELAASGGKASRVSSELRGHWLYINPHGESPDSQMRAIAGALCATVTNKNGVLVFARTPSDRRALAAETAETREKWLLGRIDRVTKYRKVFGASSTPEAFLAAAQNQISQIDQFMKGTRASIDQFYPEQTLPFQSTLHELIHRMGTKRLSTIPPGRAEVFTLNGSGGTQKLPECGDLLKAYEAQMEPFREAVQTEQHKNVLRQLPNLSQFVDVWPTRARLEQLRLVAQSTETGLLFEFSGYTGSGARMFCTYFDAGPVDGTHSPVELLRMSAVGDLPRKTELSAAAQAAARFAKVGIERNQDVPDWFSKPDKQDPLSGFVTESIASLLKAEPPGPSVFVLSDSLIKTVRDCIVDKELNLDAVKAAMVEWSDYSKLEKDGWSIWRPKHIEWAEDLRADRRALAQFVSSYQARGPELRSLCRMYARSSKVPRGLSAMWASLLYRQQGRVGFYGVSPYLFSALGTVSDVTWNRLFAGDSIRLQSAGLAEAVHDWFQFEAFKTADAQVKLTDWQRTPLSSLGTNDLNTAIISVAPKKISLYRAWVGEQEVEGGDPLDRLKQRFVRFAPGDIDSSDGKLRLKLTRAEFEARNEQFRFRTIQQDQWDIRILLGDERYIAESIRGEFVPSSAVIPYSKLPEDVRASIWENAVAFNLSR